MSKYNISFVRKDLPRKTTRKVHPIWRGIGFLMIILIPGLSYVASLVILQENKTRHWFPLPTDLLVRWQDPEILIKVLLTIIIAVVVYSLFMLVTFLLNSMFGGAAYIPPDAPPVSKGELKKYHR